MGTTLQSCGNNLLTCGNEFETCGNDLLTCGNELSTCGNELLTCGHNFISCGNEIKKMQGKQFYVPSRAPYSSVNIWASPLAQLLKELDLCLYLCVI